MNSVDKLRELAKQPDSGYWLDEFNEIADEIEAEAAERERLLKQSESATEDYYKDMIAEEFMPLPKDADGVPIRVGDMMQCEHFGNVLVAQVAAVSECGFIEYRHGELYGPFPACEWTHYHPPTVGDVLREVWKEAVNYARSDIWRSPDEAFVEYAEKIREVMADE